MQKDDELARYIRSELQHGTPKSAVIPGLIAGGWPAADVERVFAEVEQNIKKGAYPAPATGYAVQTHKHHFFKNTFLVLVVLAVAFLAVAYYLGGQP